MVSSMTQLALSGHIDEVVDTVEAKLRQVYAVPDWFTP